MPIVICYHRHFQCPDEAQPHYKTIKTMYPHYVCSKSNDGVYAYYERPGEIEIAQVCAFKELILFSPTHTYIAVSKCKTVIF
jgi:hypothetical protein